MSAVQDDAGPDFRVLFDTSPTPALVLRADAPRFTIAAVSDEYLRITGQAREELLGRAVAEAFPATCDRDAVGSCPLQASLARVAATGMPDVMPVQAGRSGDDERCWRPVTTAVRDPRTGQVAHLVHRLDDVTEIERLRAAGERERREAEGAGRRATHLYALAAALSTASTLDDVAAAVVMHGAAVFGAAGIVITRVDPAREELEIMRVDGMPDEVRDTFRRIPLAARVPLCDVARTGHPVFLPSLAAWEQRYPDLVPLVTATGHAANAVAPLVAEGRVLGAIGIAFEAPRPFDEDERSLVLAVAAQCAQALERARLHEAERRARQEAEAANRAKGEFLATMSHELRTPLNAIDGYAELMELGIRGPVTEQQRHDLGRIRNSQRHLLGLVNGVLNYSRVEAGAVHYEIDAVPLDEVLATCEALVSPQVRAKGLTLSHDGCDPSLHAHADREKLRQVVLNLLTNAIKFTEPGGRLALQCAALDGQVHVRVADTGCGIPTEQLARVFEPFVQLDARLTRTQEGVGLGLAISRDLARGMGGDITVTSTPGVGSTFTLMLPAA